jgi:O-antigen ligase
MSLLPILLPFGLASVGKEPMSLRWLYGMGTLAVALAVVASGTRAAWLGLFALAVSSGATTGGRRFTWMLLGAFLVVSLAVALWLPRSSPRRLLLLGPTGEAQRLVQWKAAWILFSERPLLGHGPQSFRRLCIARHERPGSIFAEIDLDQAPYPHDLYLEALVGTGVVGLVALLLPVALGFRDLRRSWRAGLPEGGIAAALAVFVVIGVVDLSFAKDWIHLAFWLPIGAAAGLASDRDAQLISCDAANA